MKILHVVGARPNFMKVAPVMRAFSQRENFQQLLVHTGQHYDNNMSEVFFHQLNIPTPDINLEVGSGSHAQQTAQIMSRFETVLIEQKPDLVLVYGDVNSTVAATLVCVKLNIPVGHVEAGLRSFDRTMPEEINRLITDQIADLLFTPSVDGNENLIQEGVAREKIHLVGNVMIDTLVHLLPKADENIVKRLIAKEPEILAILEQGTSTSPLVFNPYALVTLHRPSNVDDTTILLRILMALNEISYDLPIIFPLHPRTLHRFQKMNITINKSRFKMIDPLGYLPFLALQQNATIIITDSGGIQEESTFLGVPCLTIRENTERPVTVTMGTNILIGQDMTRLKEEVNQILGGGHKSASVPPFWDGKSSERIVSAVSKWRTKNGSSPMEPLFSFGMVRSTKSVSRS